MNTTKTFQKIDDNTLEIIETTVFDNEIKNSTYVYNDLVTARDNLIAQKASSNADFDQKIADAQAVIDEANNLGIIPVVLVETTPVS